MAPPDTALPIPGDPEHPARRALRRIVLLRPGEGRTLLWAGAYFFCLLSSYYLLRPMREEFGIRGELSDLPWLWTGTSLTMLLATPLFAWLVSRMPRRRFIPLTYRFFAFNLLIFYAVLVSLAHEQEKPVGYIFYIWLSVYNLFAISVFWGFMADLFKPEQAKRLFGVIGVGGTLGGIAGGVLVELITTRTSIAPVHLMLLSAALLEGAVWCVRRLTRRLTTEPETIPASGSVAAPESREPSRNPWAGFTLIARSPYLLALCIYMLMYTLSGSFLYFEQARIAKSEFADSALRTMYFNRLDLFTNIVTLFTQLFITGRLVTRLGVIAGLALLPCVVIAGFTALWFAPRLGLSVVIVFAAFRVLQRSMHYAIDRPTREMLYTPLNADAKYKSKSFIDTFVYRGGDVLGAWMQAIALVALYAAPIGAALGIAWLGVAATVAALHRSVMRFR